GGRGITGDRTEGERERREVTVGLANSPVRLIPGSPDHLGVAERIARGRYSCRRSRRQGEQILVDVEDTVAVTRQGKGTGNCCRQSYGLPVSWCCSARGYQRRLYRRLKCFVWKFRGVGCCPLPCVPLRCRPLRVH